MSQPKEFIKLQPKEWQLIYKDFLNYTHQFTTSPDALNDSDTTIIIDFLKERIMSTYALTSSISEAIARILFKNFTSPNFSSLFADAPSSTSSPSDTSSPDIEEAILSTEDIHALRTRLLHEPSKDVRRLLTALLVYARSNPHPNNWIRYDHKNIMFLASLLNKRVSEQNALSQHLYTNYSFDMQVVGSNNPIPCYKIDWQASESPLIDSPDSPNRPVLIGPLSPDTITIFADALPYEPLTETQGE